MKIILRATTLFGVILGLILLMSATVDARSRRRYRPVKVGQFSGQTTTTGTRGFCEDSKTRLALTAIAPLSHTGQTSGNQPTLAWFVPGHPAKDAVSYKMELILLKETQEKTQPPRRVVWRNSQLQSKPGIMTFKLPNEVKLLPGERYIWQIVLKCNPSLPSQNQVAEAPIQRVAAGSASDSANEEHWYDLWEGMDDASIQSKLADVKPLIADLIEIESQFLKDEPAPGSRSPQPQLVKAQRDRLQQVLEALEPVTHQDHR